MADDRFFVKSLTLENFRCFEKTELGPFDPHFNLLIGENGSGKSSVLLALASMFWDLAPDGGDLSAQRLADLRDIRLEHRTAPNGVVSLHLHRPALLRAEAHVAGEGDFENWLVPIGVISNDRLPAGFRLRPPLLGRDELGKLPDKDTPIFAFYRVDRNLNHSRANPSGAVPILSREAGLQGWTNATVNAEALREWFKTQTLADLQRLLRAQASGTVGAAKAVRQLYIVNKAIIEAVDSFEKMDFDADREDIVVQFNDGQRYDFSQMSDGQRALIGLVADIARRVCLLNASYFGEDVLTKSRGLVLIDEIDLHLHPKWQRQIVGALKRIFPKIQFFATTHSPQVIGEVQPHEVVALAADGQQKRPPQSFGMDSNWILECVMGAEGRDPAIASKIKRLFDSLDGGQFEEARCLLEEVRDVIGEAPDVVAADAYLWNLGAEADETAE